MAFPGRKSKPVSDLALKGPGTVMRRLFDLQSVFSFIFRTLPVHCSFVYVFLREALAQGFNHFKVKVGITPEDDSRRLGLVRSIIDDPANWLDRKTQPPPESLVGKNAGPTGGVLMMDANQGKS